MTEQSPASFRQGVVFVLGQVGLMIIGFALAAFSAVYVFRHGSAFLTPFISLGVPGVFLFQAFLMKFPKIGRDWNALLVFTIGAYALCLAPLAIVHILNFILKNV